MTSYPFVPGHEAAGRVIALGEHARGLKIGQRIGVGWNAANCMHCHPCLSGDQHLCSSLQPSIIDRHGAFAARLRVYWAWAIPLPDALESKTPARARRVTA